VRLGGAQPGQMIGEGGIPSARPAERAAGTRIDLPVHGVIRLALDNLAGCEAQGLRPRSPPPAGRLPGQDGVEIVTASRVTGPRMSLGLPDVAEAVTLGDGDHHGQPAASLPTGNAEPRDRP
jgi:hypothetical protein